MGLPPAMGSGPLAQPLFNQYRCTHGRADPRCCNGSEEISAIQDRLGSITIKRSNLITLDLLQSPAAQPREVLDRLPVAQPITPGLEQRRHRSRGQATLLSIPLPAGRPPPAVAKPAALVLSSRPHPETPPAERPCGCRAGSPSPACWPAPCQRAPAPAAPA
jgi:hypothetical protein